MVIEISILGIVFGFPTMTIFGLFILAYLNFRRGKLFQNRLIFTDIEIKEDDDDQKDWWVY